MSKLSVFLVEDEVMIRMMVADMLEDLGYSIAAEAGSVEEALTLLQSNEFDLAILDVNLNGKPITPVAQEIRARNHPFFLQQDTKPKGFQTSFEAALRFRSRFRSTNWRK